MADQPLYIHASQPLLSIDQLSVSLPAGADRALALDGVSLTLNRNEIVCVVGESGSGKSMTASTVMRLLPNGVGAKSGAVRLNGEDLLDKSEADMRKIRGARIGMIFQEPMTALNPLKRVGKQIGEVFREHTELSAAQIQQRVLALLSDVQLPRPEQAARAYPHQLSGGQRQRAMIAMALALDPELLIADEPTTALDVTTQAQILRLIRDLQVRKGTGVLFITHDFGVVADIADRVVVLRGGKVVEAGPANAVLNAPQHDYTKALIAAVPKLEPRAAEDHGGQPIILEARNLTKTYGRKGWLADARLVHALDDVSFTLSKGTTLGIVGESGSGKSTLARCLVRLLDPDAGTVRIGDLDFSSLSPRERRKHAGVIQMVFQDPFASLNPRRRVGELVAQPLMIQGKTRRQAMERAAHLLSLVGLDSRALDRFPHEFSGGQRQRIGLARALALEPQVMVADEPVSALDVSIQAQVLELFQTLKTELSLSMIFITHDLRVTAQICDEIAVMKDGRIVERGATAAVFADPRHDYTRLLLASVPGRLNIREHAATVIT